MMKIAQVTHNYLPHIGGVEFYVKRIVDSLQEKKMDVVVLTTDMATQENGRKAEARYFKTSFAYLRNPVSMEYIRHLKKNHYDIIHIHSVWFLHGLLATWFRKDARIIATIHGVYPDNSTFKLRFFLSIYKYFVGYILGKAEKVLVYSDLEKAKLQKIFNVPADKVAILPMAINIVEDNEFVKEKVILFTGRIIPDKNPDVLLKAVARLDQRFDGYKVVLVGPITDAYKKELNSLADSLGILPRIEFTGQLDPSVDEEKTRLQNHYKSATVFVSLGSWEGQPTRLMEAMQYRTPVIAFGAGGTADFVKDHQNGFVIDKLNEVELAHRLEMILSDEKLAKKLGAAARVTIEQDYSWDKIFAKILFLYQDEHMKN